MDLQKLRIYKRQVLQTSLDALCALNEKPYISVVFHEDLNLPAEAFNNNVITLCIAASAVKFFTAGTDGYTFNITIAGVPYNVFIPYELIIGIHSKSGLTTTLPVLIQSNMFTEEKVKEEQSKPEPIKRNHLTLVKG